MAGLLDGLFNSEQGILGMSLLAAAAPQAGPRNTGAGLLQALQNVQGFRDGNARRKAEEEDRALRLRQIAAQEQQQQLAMEHMRQQMADAAYGQSRQRAMDALPAQFMRTQAKPPTMDNRDVGQPGEQPLGQQFDLPGYANALFAHDPRQAIALRASMQKDDTPIKLGAGEAAYGRDGRLLFQNQKVDDDEFSKAMRAAGIGPESPLYRQLALQRAQKMATHAPGTNVNVNTEKPLLNTVAEGLGKQIDNSLAEAKAATRAIGTAHTIRQAIDSGKVISGPGATFRVAGLQIGQMLGVGGKDGAEVLSNTRGVIQSMAQAELDAAQQMRGQGQITEAERDIIRRAASGNIDSLTTPEIRLLTDTMEKVGRLKITAHRRNTEALGRMPNAAPLMQFYQVDEPAAYGGAAAGNAGRVRRYNPATGRLE